MGLEKFWDFSKITSGHRTEEYRLLTGTGIILSLPPSSFLFALPLPPEIKVSLPFSLPVHPWAFIGLFSSLETLEYYLFRSVVYWLTDLRFPQFPQLPQGDPAPRAQSSGQCRDLYVKSDKIIGPPRIAEPALAF